MAHRKYRRRRTIRLSWAHWLTWGWIVAMYDWTIWLGGGFLFYGVPRWGLKPGTGHHSSSGFATDGRVPGRSPSVSPTEIARLQTRYAVEQMRHQDRQAEIDLRARQNWERHQPLWCRYCHQASPPESTVCTVCGSADIAIRYPHQQQTT